jgi:hypothetical protein
MGREVNKKNRNAGVVETDGDLELRDANWKRGV